MPARTTRQVVYLTDATSRPPCRYEAVTASPTALAFRLDGTRYDPDIPDHSQPRAVLTCAWGVIEHNAAPDAVPAMIYYDRAEALPFEVHGARYAQLGEAMEAAVGL